MAAPLAIFYFPLLGTPTAEGNLLTFYEAGTDVPLLVYTDIDGLLPWSQPIVFNAAGNPDGVIYVNDTPSYKVVYTDANGVAIPGYPVDFVPPGDILNVTTNAVVTLTNAQIKALPTTGITLVAAPGAGLRIVPFAATLNATFLAGAYTGVNTTYAALQFAYAPGTIWALTPIVNDSTLTAPLSRLTTFMNAADRVATLAPYIEDIQANGGGGDFGYPDPQVIVTPTHVDNVALTVSIDNNGSGNLGGGNILNSLKISVYYGIETT